MQVEEQMEMLNIFYAIIWWQIFMLDGSSVAIRKNKIKNMKGFFCLKSHSRVGYENKFFSLYDPISLEISSRRINLVF
jgi:hypothetical protein